MGKQKINSAALFWFFLIASFNQHLFSQVLNPGNISADLQTDFQYNDETLSKDSATTLNVYLNASYRYMGFDAGVRYEAFQTPLVGYPKGMEGQGIPYRYISFQRERFKVTVGSYYTQFGNGLVLRSYEARGLGLDNSLDGIKLEYNIKNKIFLTALSGRQRHFFDPYQNFKSIIRGADGEANIAKFFFEKIEIIFNLGGSYVSRYYPPHKGVALPNNDSLPPLVNAYSVRSTLGYKNISISGEYAKKSDDPSTTDLYSHGEGEALYVMGSYTQKGLGINLQYKKISDFEFRSDPTSSDYNYLINFVPPLEKLHEFKLFTKYPYQTQYMAEEGIQAEINYSPVRGTNFIINHTFIQSLEKEKYLSETSLRTERKFNSKWTATVAYEYLEINSKKVLLSSTADFVYAHIVAVEGIYRFLKKHSVRTDLQYLQTKNDKGDWAFGQIEYTFAPHFGIAFFDEYNIGKDKKHYFTAFVSYIDGSTKFSLSYGKQSGGVSCVGGVCRYVPAFSGLTFSVISKF